MKTAAAKAVTPTVAKDLRDLRHLREQIARQRQNEQALRPRATAQATRQEPQETSFAAAVGRVQPLNRDARACHDTVRPAPQPLQRQRDERAALRQALSDEVDLESLLLTDDGLGYRRPEVGTDVLTRLRRGHWAIARQIDLHGLRSDEARAALADFIRSCNTQGQRCVRVIHGKGHGSPGRQPVLKMKAQRWLAQRQEVLAFTQASAPQGGAGALIVLLAGR